MLYFNIFRRWRNVVGLMAFFLLFPVDAKTAVDHFHPDMLSYSMQIASLSDREKAVSYYQDLEQKLPDDLVDELRLEFIDPYYSLRMGFEKKESTLQGLAEKVQPFFPQAILIRCALIQERIIMASARVNEIHESKLSVTSDAPEYQKQPARAISDLDFAQADNHGQLPAQTGSTLSADDFFMAELYRARDDLTRRKRPYAGLLGGYFTDKNDLSVMHGGAFGRVVVFDGLDFTARVMTGMISQSSDGQRPRTRLRRSSFMLGINDYFLTPELIVWASAMLESFNMRDHGNAPEGSRLGLDKDYVAGGAYWRQICI